MDDTSFLLSNSQQASYLALVDSAERDTKTWPTAAEFEVTFDTPFTNVFGIDLLGVNAPRTEYTVSSSRNRLVFSFGAPGVRQKHAVRVPEGDYDQAGFVQAFNLALAGYTSSTGSSLTVSSVSSVATVANRVKLTCPEAFTVYLSDSSARLVIGFADPVNSSSSLYAAPGWSPGKADTVTSVLGPGQGAADEEAFTGPSVGNVASPVTAYKQPQQVFTAASSGIVTAVSFAFSSIGTAPAGPLTWQVSSPDGTTPFGSGQVQPDLDQVLTSATFDSAQAPLAAGSQYLLTLTDPSNGDASNCFTVLSANGTMAATVTVQAATNVLTAPGLLDLTGERYILLRCLEIETPINRSRAFERWTAGVGMIQLGTYGYSTNSYDYTAYPPRTFPPIGSLAKLTLSFRKSDGSLYDFKGLNLQLLLLIKFLQPDTPADNNRRTPQYSPYLPQVVSRRLQEEVASDPRYSWMPR